MVEHDGLWQLPQSTALLGCRATETVARPTSRIPDIDPYSDCGNCHSRCFRRGIRDPCIRTRAADRVRSAPIDRAYGFAHEIEVDHAAG
jgi:hypothetical protein